MENIEQGLLLTAIGIGVVFLVLGINYVLIRTIRFFAMRTPKETEAVPQAVEATTPVAEIEQEEITEPAQVLTSNMEPEKPVQESEQEYEDVEDQNLVAAITVAIRQYEADISI